MLFKLNLVYRYQPESFININFFYRDAILVTILNCSTSIFAGFAVFAIIGFMAGQLSLDVDKVAAKGESIYI